MNDRAFGDDIFVLNIPFLDNLEFYMVFLHYSFLFNHAFIIKFILGQELLFAMFGDLINLLKLTWSTCHLLGIVV